MEERRKIIKRICIIFFALLSLVIVVASLFQIGVIYTERSWRHWRPSYDRVDISPILSKSVLSEDDYDTLYRQTGIAKAGIDDCLSQGDVQTIIRTQDAFFATANVKNHRFAPYTYMEMTDIRIPLSSLKKGDVLITAASRLGFYRYGHSALVVDEDGGWVLESVDLTSKSQTRPASIFSSYANFIILRPKADDETKTEVVRHAMEHLQGLPYSSFAGVFGQKYVDEPTATHCSHLVWSAYMHCGIDLERDGGIVQPQDFLTDKVEVVQVYGFDLDTLWR